MIRYDEENKKTLNRYDLIKNNEKNRASGNIVLKDRKVMKIGGSIGIYILSAFVKHYGLHKFKNVLVKLPRTRQAFLTCLSSSGEGCVLKIPKKMAQSEGLYVYSIIDVYGDWDDDIDFVTLTLQLKYQNDDHDFEQDI